MARTEQHREVGIATPLGENVLLVSDVSCTEQLGRLFQYDLNLVSENRQIAASEIVGKNVTVRLNLTGNKTRYFNGYVNRFVQIPTTGAEARYRMGLVPWFWFLTRTADCRMFQNMKVPDIIKQVFRDRGFTDFDDRLNGTYRTWEYCVQYRETDFNFISRLMEQEGIYYFFEHDNGKHTMVLADSPSAHKPFPGYEKIKHRIHRAEKDEEIITQWVNETTLQPGAYALDDFDFKNVQKDLKVRSVISREHDQANFEVFDYPGEYIQLSEGETYAKIRIEEFHSQYERATGVSDARGISVGHTFKLIECPRSDQNREYLITSAVYQIDAGTFESGRTGGEMTYSCTFTARNATETFRSMRTTPKPSIPGPQTAIVVGPSGEEIHADEYGRVKVQFHWDRYGKADQNSSCWIRVAQVWAGKKWGGMYIPRIGQEVIVEFLEGDPDQPIITGRVYNAANMPPYELPGEKTKSTLKSNSSKGGGGFNEIRFEDKKGSEQIFIHGEKNRDTRIKNDTFEWIGNNKHLIVKKDQYEQVEGDKHLTVKGDRTTSIEGDENCTIGGDRLTEIKGKSHLKITGDDFQKISGNQHLKTDMNLNEEVGQKLSIKAGTDIHEKAGMNYAMNAGMNVHIKGGMAVVIEGGVQLSLKVGGNFIDINPAGVFIQGTMVMINSGGAAGSGSGSSPTAPTAPESPAKPTLPEEADKAQPGQKEEPPKPPKPPKPVKFSPQATTLKNAAQSGTPFCEKCEEAKKKAKK